MVHLWFFILNFSFLILKFTNAIDWYVSPEGSDILSCGTNINDPCLSISYLVSNLAGVQDHIYLSNGLYSECNILINFSLYFHAIYPHESILSCSNGPVFNATLNQMSLDINDLKFSSSQSSSILNFDLINSNLSLSSTYFFSNVAENLGIIDISFHGTNSIGISSCVFSSNEIHKNSAIFITSQDSYYSFLNIYNNSFISNLPSSSVGLITLEINEDFYSSFLFSSNSFIENQMFSASVLSISCLDCYHSVFSISNSLFTNNNHDYNSLCSIPTNTLSYGGAIQVQINQNRKGSNTPSLFLTNTTFSSNNAHYGGAVSFSGYIDILLNNLQFLNNKACIYGGALFLENDIDLILRDSWFSNNYASEGLALFSTSISYHLIESVEMILNEVGNHLNIISAQSITHHNFFMKCSRGLSLNHQFSSVPSYSFLTSCSSCPSGSYSVISHELTNQSYSLECQSCPLGTQCSNGQISVWPHYYASLSNDGNIKSFYCPMDYCCSPTSDDTCSIENSCSQGREGFLCGTCSENLFETTRGRCVKNCENSVFFFLYIVIISIIFILVSFFCFLKTKTAIFDIFLYWSQLVFLLTPSSWSFYSFVQIFHFIVPDISDIGYCISEHFSRIDILGIPFILPSTIIFFSLLTIIINLFNSKDENSKISSFIPKTVTILFKVFSFLYQPILFFSLSLLDCTSFNNGYHMILSGTTSCFSNWQIIILFIIILFLIFPFFLELYRRYLHNVQPSVFRYAFVWNLEYIFKMNFSFWHLIIKLRSFILVIIIIFIKNPFLSSLLFFIVIILNLLLNYLFKPYRYKNNEYFEQFLLLILLLFLYLSSKITFLNFYEPFFDKSNEEFLVTISHIIFYVFFFGSILIGLFIYFTTNDEEQEHEYEHKKSSDKVVDDLPSPKVHLSYNSSLIQTDISMNSFKDIPDIESFSNDDIYEEEILLIEDLKENITNVSITDDLPLQSNIVSKPILEVKEINEKPSESPGIAFVRMLSLRHLNQVEKPVSTTSLSIEKSQNISNESLENADSIWQRIKSYKNEDDQEKEMKISTEKKFTPIDSKLPQPRPISNDTFIFHSTNALTPVTKTQPHISRVESLYLEKDAKEYYSHKALPISDGYCLYYQFQQDECLEKPFPANTLRDIINESFHKNDFDKSLFPQHEFKTQTITNTNIPSLSRVESLYIEKDANNYYSQKTLPISDGYCLYYQYQKDEYLERPFPSVPFIRDLVFDLMQEYHNNKCPKISNLIGNIMNKSREQKIVDIDEKSSITPTNSEYLFIDGLCGFFSYSDIFDIIGNNFDDTVVSKVKFEMIKSFEISIFEKKMLKQYL